jgi:hypothetical protein
LIVFVEKNLKAMQSLSIFLVTLIASAALISGLVIPKKQFTGHSVLRIKVESQVHVKALRSLESVHGILADFWLSPKKIPGIAHIRVTPENEEKIVQVLKEVGMKHEIMIDDLQSLIDKEAESLAKRTVFKAGDNPSFITTNEYHNYSEIHAYLDSVGTKYGYKVDSVGQSNLGIDLKYIRIGKNPNATKEVFINGCIHAREWLGCATMVYIINELTTKPDQYDDLLSNLNIYVLPVLNPDGYDYTWGKDRMWRKTRSGPRQGCYGVDPNRLVKIFKMVLKPATIGTTPKKNWHSKQNTFGNKTSKIMQKSIIKILVTGITNGVLLVQAQIPALKHMMAQIQILNLKL